jgi:hypothetical protein
MAPDSPFSDRSLGEFLAASPSEELLLLYKKEDVHLWSFATEDDLFGLFAAAAYCTDEGNVT